MHLSTTSSARVVDPAQVAEEWRTRIRADIAALGQPLGLVGLLAADHGPSGTYAEYTRKACADVGVRFDLRRPTRLDLEAEILTANADPDVHGIMIYYPVFGTEQDAYLRDVVAPEKDMEGLNRFWARCLYDNRRFLDAAQTQKAILPCTPLAILKLVQASGIFASSGRPLAGKTACVFNRSEVVGRPLAAMLANDGARVVSFDVDGSLLFAPDEASTGHVVLESSLGRAEALAMADVVITGIPSRQFVPITAAEIRPGAVCLNFSTLRNFADDIETTAGVWIPRVGPMTVTMALRNTLQLYRNTQLAGRALGSS